MCIFVYRERAIIFCVCTVCLAIQTYAHFCFICVALSSTCAFDVQSILSNDISYLLTPHCARVCECVSVLYDFAVSFRFDWLVVILFVLFECFSFFGFFCSFEYNSFFINFFFTVLDSLFTLCTANDFSVCCWSFLFQLLPTFSLPWFSLMLELLFLYCLESCVCV